jgi:hypothetical protein
MPKAMRLPAVLITLAASALWAGDGPVTEMETAPGIAFARYVGHVEQTSPWQVETVEVDATLPKLAKKGRLRAIRRLLPSGKPEFQVLESAGDQTVRRQVILRYFSAQVQAGAIPSSSVAINTANYRFRYKGLAPNGETNAFVFFITPKTKRDGLIKGELWLDAETGVPVRESGYLVKKPSIFLKRVVIDRATAYREGNAESRVTHLSIDTRLVGRAELTVTERPGISIAERSNADLVQ